MREALRRKQKAPKGISDCDPTNIGRSGRLLFCRAVLFAQLVDDPSACKDEFPTVEGAEGRSDEKTSRTDPRPSCFGRIPTNETCLERSALRNCPLVCSFTWPRSLPALDAMRPQEIIDYSASKRRRRSTILFSGGGSIPLEAQRLGLAGDGIGPESGRGPDRQGAYRVPTQVRRPAPVHPEADELRHWSGSRRAGRRYSPLWALDARRGRRSASAISIPMLNLKDGSERQSIAWLWARTVPSPDPRAGARPFRSSSSFVLSSKAGKEVIVRPVVDRTAADVALRDRRGAECSGGESGEKGTKAARRRHFVCLLTGAAIDE